MITAVEVQHLTKTFKAGAPALNDVSFRVAEGEMVALLGASGSGKSTLLRQIAGLQRSDRRPGACQVSVLGREVQSSGRLHADVRSVRSEMGMVFQQFNLIERSAVITNVLAGLLHRVPLWRSMLHLFTTDERHSALKALQHVGIADQAYKRAKDLSGGQQQRAAIARAVVQKARVMLADEPIASLDPDAARRVMELLASLNREQRVTVIVSLHQVSMAMRYCPRTIALRNGQIVFDGPSDALSNDRLRELYGSDSAELFGAQPADGSVSEPSPSRSEPTVRPWAVAA